MGRVVKGVLIAGAIMAVPIAGALFLPGAAAAFFASSTAWGFASALAVNSFLSGVSAQLRGKSRSARAHTEVEYAGTVEARRILYGELRVSGMHVIPPLTSGDSNKMLHTVLALAGHEVNAIGDVYFNQDLIDSADIGSITGAATDGLVGGGDYEDRAWIRRYTGTSTQTADYILNTAFTEWTSDHRGRSVAYIAVQLQYDEEVYKTGKPDYSCIVQGKKCYDPRLDTSPGANPTNASYIAYTNNPALCLADYLIDDDLGLGEDPARIDWDMVEAAADICDESVDVPTGATQSRYTCNTALLATTPYENNIEALAACMLGSCLYSGGKWRIRAGAWETPSFEITADNVMNGGVQISTAYPYKERWNGIRGSYVEPDNQYQAAEFPAVQDATYVSDDGESVFKDMAFPGCTNVYEAQRNAIMLVRKSRNKRSAIIQCDLSAFRIRPGDTGIVTLDEVGWTNQQVRCEGWKINPAGSIEIAVREESSDDWNDPLESDYLEPLAISTPAQAYFIPAAPSSLTAVGGKNAIALTWAEPALVPTGMKWQVLQHSASTPYASASVVWEGIGTNAIIPRSNTDTVYFWIRGITPEGTVGSEYPTSSAGVSGAAVLIDTADIASGAASIVHTATATGVTITQAFTTPSEAVQTVASVTFTPPVSCFAEVTATINFTHDMSDPVFEAIAYDLVKTGDTVSYKAIRSARDTSTTKDSFTASETMSLTANAEHTIRLGMAKLSSGTSLVVDRCTLRVTEIRR